ncbi:MAG TPA: hypothetical protein VNF50_05730, partial [Acidimicrobiales bacterium]|nr:hypothetical protein [Acidimicrobiales bacterium]
GMDNRWRRERFEFRPGMASLPETLAPNLRNRSWRLLAELHVPESGTMEGVIATQGSNAGGWATWVKDGRLHYVYNFLGAALTTVSAEVPLPPGPVTARIEFTATGAFQGDIDLYYGDVPVGQGHIPRTHLITFGMHGFTVGYQRGPAVSPSYEGRFEITPGSLERVVIEAAGRAWRDPEREDRAAMSIQ